MGGDRERLDKLRVHWCKTSAGCQPCTERYSKELFTLALPRDFATNHWLASFNKNQEYFQKKVINQLPINEANNPFIWHPASSHLPCKNETEISCLGYASAASRQEMSGSLKINKKHNTNSNLCVQKTLIRQRLK